MELGSARPAPKQEPRAPSGGQSRAVPGAGARAAAAERAPRWGPGAGAGDGASRRPRGHP